jgi:hypothetical protein
MMSIRDLLMPMGLILCALSAVAPNAIANYSRERWLRADVSRRLWKRAFVNLVMQPWYPTFIRFYGLFGFAFLLSYLVFFRFSK